MRIVWYLVVSCLLLAGCGSGRQAPVSTPSAQPATATAGPAGRVSSPVPDSEEAPYRWPPCQSEADGEHIAGSPATYVPGRHPYLLGCIMDPSGAAIRNAGAYADPTRAAATMTAIGTAPTGADGRYEVPAIVEPGWYTIIAEARGYRTVRKRVFVDPNRTTVLDFVLRPDS
jgi:hypothetical protein